MTFSPFLPVKIGVIFLNVSARFNCLATRQPSGNWEHFHFQMHLRVPVVIREYGYQLHHVVSFGQPKS